MSDYLSFHLPDEFVKSYSKRKVRWGYPCGGDNTLGEITYLTKYSRKKEDGTKERWHETCRRVVEGYYSILKDHCKTNKTPWNELKAQNSAEDAYDRMFAFKWLPPGRGIQFMGTRLVNEEKNSGPLYNCLYLSTEKLSSRSVYDATYPFVRLMEQSMNGCGVGFCTRGADKLTIHEPTEESWIFVIPDTREGWSESVQHLLESYFFKNRKTVTFDYTQIRPEGAPLKRFGGIASGYKPLEELHTSLRNLLGERNREKLSSMDILDIMNLIGKAVLAGGVRRTAELCLGDIDDKEFLDAKNWKKNPKRMGKNGWGNLSNNSVIANSDDDLSHLVERISMNGEPGIFFLDIAQTRGRLKDKPSQDSGVKGVNPCSEILLEPSEACNLCETFPYHHDDIEDFKTTIKYAYMYSKAVTLLPTPWEETNEIITRNRRIGASMSGIVQFAEEYGWHELRQWCDEGYKEIRKRDESYSAWLGIRESIRKSTVKPSGSISLLCGATPGVHWPTASGKYIRRQRFAKHDPIVKVFKKARYPVEDDIMAPKSTVVVSFPTMGQEMRDTYSVSVWEKVALAALMQHVWSDNSVSATFSFDKKTEKDQIAPILRAFAGKLKTMSFLPSEPGIYKQAPYEKISEEEFNKMFNKIKKLDMKALYSGKGTGNLDIEKYCSGDRCEISF